MTHAHVPHVYERRAGLPYARVLLVNPSALPATDAELVCIQTPVPGRASSPLRCASDEASSRVAWLTHGPSMSSLEPRLRAAFRSGRFLSAASEQAAAYVSEDDVALAAAASLSSDAVPAGVHVIHGPHALSHRQVVALAAELLGRPITLEASPLSELEASLVDLGLSCADARAAREADHALLQGGRSPRSDAFSRITGLNPLNFRKYLEEQHELWAAPALASANSSSTHARGVTPSGLVAKDLSAAALRVSA